ncbi:MAG: DUF1080 domain-containing protein [Acidobacteria bacterium]|nr:DUF1080 domain-containing protein [Acidobacteriota bacterium]
MRTILLATLLAAAAAAQTANTLSAEEKKAGWKLLFDGKTMNGWLPVPADAWAVEDGCLKSLSRPLLREDLVSKKEFGDFELAFEWKVAPGSNSGVKYKIQDTVLVDDHQTPQRMSFEKQVDYFMKTRAGKRELVKKGDDAQVFPVAFEYQVIDNDKHSDALRNASSRAGALYRMSAPSQAAAKPVGEFNQARIVVRGKHVEHWLNGVKVVDTTFDAPEVRAGIEQRWAPDSPVRDLLERLPKARCPISLQNHNDVAWYRNIKFRDLK